MTIDTKNPTPAQAEKAALFFDILQDARNAGKGWWASSQYRQIELSIEQDRKLALALEALKAILAHRPDYPDTIWQQVDDAIATIEGKP